MRKSPLFLSLFLLVLIPSAVSADSGVPVLVLMWPYMFLGLIPIAIAEGLVYRRKLDLETRPAFRLSAVVNLVSTSTGLPIIFLVLLFLDMSTGADKYRESSTFCDKLLYVIWQDPGHMQATNSDYGWMVPVRMLVLFIPFFFATWWLETYLVSKALPAFDKVRVRATCFWANLVSYSMLALVPAASLIIALMKQI